MKAPDLSPTLCLQIAESSVIAPGAMFSATDHFRHCIRLGWAGTGTGRTGKRCEGSVGRDDEGG